MLLPLTLFLQLASPEPAQDLPTVRDARIAQARFERVRQAHLPVKLSGATAGHCDIRVGRFCYWYDSSDTVVEPEHPRIIRAREELLATLSGAARADSPDEWLVGQRVRYLLEAGSWSDAVNVTAQDCTAPSWWCSALRATALHVGQQHAEADVAFTRALRDMPEEERCEWTDPRPVADHDLARRMDAFDCDRRATAAEQLWRLGQPLWLTGGNDLRSEHLARHTMARVFRGSAMANGLTFGEDSRELVLRYGWSEWFTRYEPPMTAYPSRVITGHTRSPSYYFLPDIARLEGLRRFTDITWNLSDSLARSRYAPRHVKRLSPLPYQLARFPRGDSTLLIAAFRVTDAAIARDSVRAGVAIWDGSGAPAMHIGARESLAITVRSDTAMASIEVHDARTLHAQRARIPVIPRGCSPGWCLSDMLFLSAPAGDSAPDPEAVLPNALGEPHLAAGTPLVVYWETTTTAERATLLVNLTVTPLRVSVLRRIAGRLRLGRRATPVRMQWQSVTRRARQPHQVTVRLPDNLSGRFRVEVVVDRAGYEPLSAARDITVVR